MTSEAPKFVGSDYYEDDDSPGKLTKENKAARNPLAPHPKPSEIAQKKKKPFVKKSEPPPWRHPLVSLADKYRLALEEIDRLNGELAKR
jgi:hypothetical protein